MTQETRKAQALKAFKKAESSFNEFHPESPDACGLDLDLMFNYEDVIKQSLSPAPDYERTVCATTGKEYYLVPVEDLGDASTREDEVKNHGTVLPVTTSPASLQEAIDYFSGSTAISRHTPHLETIIQAAQENTALKSRIKELEAQRPERAVKIKPCPVCGSGDWSCGH